jgi:hypothetical protein
MSPDSRKHRGAHPEDRRLFAEDKIPILRKATAELSWLLSRGYAAASSVKIVGDHHSLTDRQRVALGRAACSDQQREKRDSTRLSADRIGGQAIVIDGFNLIITIEAALSGGLLLISRDGCIRDLSSVHGSYRSVAETESAVRIIGETLEILEPRSAAWFLDKPVSNSGRLAGFIEDLAGRRGWPWEVNLVMNPDAALSTSNHISITSDSVILDRALRWVNFVSLLLEGELQSAWVVNLSDVNGSGAAT